MNRKSLWAVVGLVIIVAALAAVAVLYKGTGTPAAPTASTTATNSNATPNPNAPGAPFMGTLVSSTATGITVKAQDGTTKTFTISTTTSVISTVEAGVVASGLASAKAGTQLVVTFDKTSPSVVANMQLLTPPSPPPALAAGSTFASLSGTVVSHSAISLVIQKQPDNAKVTVALTKNTKVISNVSAGQTGKTLSSLQDGASYVMVQAVQTGATYSAFSVQILVPIAGGTQ